MSENVFITPFLITTNWKSTERLTVGGFVPESRVLEDDLAESLSQQAGGALGLLADPGQVSAQVNQELVVGLRDAGRLQDLLQSLSTLLHARTLCKTENQIHQNQGPTNATNRHFHFNKCFTNGGKCQTWQHSSPTGNEN